jgi:tRNA G18 (ribose-2'-O)-methylase SpoU
VARIEPISDAGDPRISAYQNLPDATLAIRHGLYVVESELVVRLAIARHLAGALRLRSLLVTPTKLAAIRDAIENLDCPVYVAEPGVVDSIAGFHVHRGVLALGERTSPMTPMDVAGQARRLLALEDLSNHDNVGGLFRAGAALGCDGVLLSPRCCDPLYRKSIRVSMGHVLRVPYAHVPDWPAGLEPLRRAGWLVVGLATSPGAQGLEALGRLAADREQRVIVMVGAEGPGLTPGALAQADHVVRIPMMPGVDSLNVVVAAGIALSRLFEEPDAGQSCPI